ncbi:MAG: chalcone isomerase family protein [Candidatus Omnitrophota bacterium]|nr:chalcone isomerase family protein [Candidatus Omnitrophota bacterium]
MHAGCLLAFVTGMSGAAIVVFLVTLLPRMFGLTAGYHRYFSHRSFKTSRIFQFILAFLGACSLQKDALWWAAHHRNHHRYADTELDPHSPIIHGFFWSHVGWFMTKKHANLHPDPHVADFAVYPELRYLNRNQKIPALFFFSVVAVLGICLERFAPDIGLTAGQVIVWGFFISTVFLFHVTFAVNSFSHLFGSKRFANKDDGRNNIWVALLTMGEGWHNNHHRCPSSERQGFYWWEIDVTHYVLTALSWIGVVWDLRRPPQDIYEEARAVSKHAIAAALVLMVLLTPAQVFAASAAEGQCLNNSCFESTTAVAGNALPLRGIGLLEFLTLDVYTAALYLPADVAAQDQVLGEVPMSLVIEYHRGLKQPQFVKAADRALGKNPTVNLQAIRDRLRIINDAYEDVEKGDRYELRYEPERGTSLLLNGVEKAIVPGEDFARAYFGIWVSEWALSGKLRDKLLSQASPKG